MMRKALRSGNPDFVAPLGPVHPEVVGLQSPSVGGPELDRSPVAAAAPGDSAPMVRERIRLVRLLPAGTAGGPERPDGAVRTPTTWGCTALGRRP